MADIKTRDAVKGTIKTIDKSAVAAERMKDAFIRTKEKAESSTSPTENSPEEYAADRVTGSAEAVTFGAAHEFDKHGRKAVQDTKENIAKAKDYLEQRRAAQPQEAAKNAAEKAQETAHAAQQPSQTVTYPNAAPTPARAPTTPAETPQPSPAGARIKTIDRQRMTIRTRESTRTAIKQPIKAGQVKTIKGTSRTVKTAEQSSRAATKASEQAARTAQASAKATVKTAEKTAQAAMVAAKTAAETAKQAAEATAKAIKAIVAGTKALIEAIVAGGWISVIIILIVVMLGVAISLFGSGSGNSSYTPVSAEVEAYTPVIRLYAQQYGVGEYVELIKAIMMQESGGRGDDPMQASESGYNTRYPHSPNAITDPEYSIDVGVQTIADSLRQADVESPIDMDNIKLALQGYNYGNGFISWARANYGGYTPIAAIEFSDMMAARMGWSGYGDKQYPAHVLRYYPIGRAFTVVGNQAIVEVALTQVGNEGGEPYWSWWGLSYRVEWCAIFVSWCAEQCGYLDAGVLPKMEGVRPYVDWFIQRDQWQDRDYKPIPGDIIFFDWESDGLADHVGIVEKVEDGLIYTVEGNSGDRCVENRYYLSSAPVYGFGLPLY
jgi:cell wall-associated NlpC family hydrolase